MTAASKTEMTGGNSSTPPRSTTSPSDLNEWNLDLTGPLKSLRFTHPNVFATWVKALKEMTHPDPMTRSQALAWVKILTRINLGSSILKMEIDPVERSRWRGNYVIHKESYDDKAIRLCYLYAVASADFDELHRLNPTASRKTMQTRLKRDLRTSNGHLVRNEDKTYRLGKAGIHWLQKHFKYS